jgi:hypothetical protein
MPQFRENNMCDDPDGAIRPGSTMFLLSDVRELPPEFALLHEALCAGADGQAIPAASSLGGLGAAALIDAMRRAGMRVIAPSSHPVWPSPSVPISRQRNPRCEPCGQTVGWCG